MDKVTRAREEAVANGFDFTKGSIIVTTDPYMDGYEVHEVLKKEKLIQIIEENKFTILKLANENTNYGWQNTVVFIDAVTGEFGVYNIGNNSYQPTLYPRFDIYSISQNDEDYDIWEEDDLVDNIISDLSLEKETEEMDLEEKIEYLKENEEAVSLANESMDANYEYWSESMDIDYTDLEEQFWIEE